ncbi:epidermal growth factor-like protein 6 isoform X2 [Danio rerio]|uniref:Epidermal growth factor-like protein 6 isoform X2 n=1 Tax=Danio rerio TaxID=7955 RepID=A0AC58GDW4_DANRE
MAHVFGLWGKPEHQEETHGNTGRTCKLHTESPTYPAETRISNLLAVRPQCKPLSHSASQLVNKNKKNSELIGHIKLCDLITVNVLHALFLLSSFSFADIDECATGKNQCPFNRQCTNTFGSYYCKCQPGYDLKYINGKYDCVDVNECTSNTHKCSHHAECINTLGSYKCKCKQGFRGSGFDCSAIPDFPSKTRILGKFENSIPEPVLTESPRQHLQPFDYDGEVYIGAPQETPVFPEEEEVEEEEEEDTENQLEDEELTSRGDVFSQDDFVSFYQSELELKEIQAAPLKERFLTDCDFDRGACEWVQDNADDLDWTIKYHPDGREYYLALEGPVGNRREQARMKLLLEDHMRQSSFCLRFDFRIEGPQTGVLRVKLDNSAISIWERKQSQKQSWQSEQISISWTDSNPEAVVFEAERGRSGTGEIALDHVLLISGECSEDKTLDF